MGRSYSAHQLVSDSVCRIRDTKRAWSFWASCLNSPFLSFLKSRPILSPSAFEWKERGGSQTEQANSVLATAFARGISTKWRDFSKSSENEALGAGWSWIFHRGSQTWTQTPGAPSQKAQSRENLSSVQLGTVPISPHGGKWNSTAVHLHSEN